MMRRWILGSGVGALLIVVAAVAQPPGGQPGGLPGGFPGGAFTPPPPGQILPTFLQERLKLTAEQKKQLAELQKEVDTKLATILTAEQKKLLQRPGGFGPGGPGGQKGPGGQGGKDGKDGPGGPGGFGPPGGFGFPGGFGGPTRLEDVKKQLSATDEEWKVIGPKIQKVISARQILTADARKADAVVGGPRPEGKPGDPPPGDGPARNPGAGPQPGPGFGGQGGTNIITQAQADLQAVLKDPKSPKAEIEEKVAAVRKARQKARADLEAAQKDLQEMLTPAQETILVSLGYLD